MQPAYGIHDSTLTLWSCVPKFVCSGPLGRDRRSSATKATKRGRGEDSSDEDDDGDDDDGGDARARSSSQVLLRLTHDPLRGQLLTRAEPDANSGCSFS